MRPWSLGDLNSLPSECKSDALPGELRPHKGVSVEHAVDSTLSDVSGYPEDYDASTPPYQAGHGHCSCSAVTTVGTSPYVVALAWKDSNLQPRD